MSPHGQMPTLCVSAGEQSYDRAHQTAHLRQSTRSCSALSRPKPVVGTDVPAARGLAGTQWTQSLMMLLVLGRLAPSYQVPAEVSRSVHIREEKQQLQAVP